MSELLLLQTNNITWQLSESSSSFLIWNKALNQVNHQVQGMIDGKTMPSFLWLNFIVHVVSSKFERPHCNEGINLTYSRFSAGRDERNTVAGARKNRGKTRVLGRLSSTYSSLAFVFNPSCCTNWEPCERANIDHDHKRYLYKNCLSQV